MPAIPVIVHFETPYCVRREIKNATSVKVGFWLQRRARHIFFWGGGKHSFLKADDFTGLGYIDSVRVVL